MLLAIDIGNTMVHFATASSDQAPFSRSLRFLSSILRTPDEWESLLAVHLQSEFDSAASLRIVLCSVVPQMTDSIVSWAQQFHATDPLLVSTDLNLGISVQTSQPEQTGQDRIVNAAAAFDQFKRDCIIVDMGTATKVDVVDSNGVFLGGAIAPGLGLSMESLTSKAARLHSVPLEVPESSIGRNTQDALQAGVVLGHLKMIEGLVAQSKESMEQNPATIMTGGYSPVLAACCAPQFDQIDPELTLRGLKLIAKLNKS